MGQHRPRSIAQLKKSLFYCPALGTGTVQDNKNANVFVHVHGQEVMLADNLRKKKLGISRRVENGRVGGKGGVHSLCKFWLVVLTIHRRFIKLYLLWTPILEYGTPVRCFVPPKDSRA